METLLLNCLQAQLVIGRVMEVNMPPQTRNDLIWEIKKISPSECKIDATAD
jgi:indole-3-glycerol phosphate synthase